MLPTLPHALPPVAASVLKLAVAGVSCRLEPVGLSAVKQMV